MSVLGDTFWLRVRPAAIAVLGVAAFVASGPLVREAQGDSQARVLPFQPTAQASGTPRATLVVHSPEPLPALLRPCIPEGCSGECIRWSVDCAACYGGVTKYTLELALSGLAEASMEPRDFYSLYLTRPPVGRVLVLSFNVDQNGVLHFQAKRALWNDLLSQAPLVAEIVAEFDDGHCGTGENDRVILEAID